MFLRSFKYEYTLAYKMTETLKSLIDVTRS